MSTLSGALSHLDFTNRFHQLSNDFYQFQLPTPIKKPYLININPIMADELGLEVSNLNNQYFADFSSGNELLDGSDPIAAIYAGHQFGHFVPQLGDGRAILLGEIKNKQQRHWELQLKGAGKTPFSRDGDGRAVLRSTIREYLCSEAMAALGIATTRSLAMIGSEQEVYRETIETGSIMLRMAPSFIRFGSFELFASRGQDDKVKELADFVLQHYYPELLINSGNPYQLLFQEIVVNTAQLIAHWQSVGFAHGVMNTDKMSIIGLTLDYGPFSFLDNYDEKYICNHSDYQGRYRFENQPYIGFWNLNCLAQAMMSLLSVEEAKKSLSLYQQVFKEHYNRLMQKKLGLFNAKALEHEKLILSLLQILQDEQIDYSLFFRELSNFNFSQANFGINKALSQLNQTSQHNLEKNKQFRQWAEKYNNALSNESLLSQQRKLAMDKINPKYIFRNYIAQTIIQKVEQEKNFQFLDRWLKVLQSPYEEHPEMESYAGIPPPWSKEINISCSS